MLAFPRSIYHYGKECTRDGSIGSSKQKIKKYKDTHTKKSGNTSNLIRTICSPWNRFSNNPFLQKVSKPWGIKGLYSAIETAHKSSSFSFLSYRPTSQHWAVFSTQAWHSVNEQAGSFRITEWHKAMGNTCTGATPSRMDDWLTHTQKRQHKEKTLYWRGSSYNNRQCPQNSRPSFSTFKKKNPQNGRPSFYQTH